MYAYTYIYTYIYKHTHTQTYTSPIFRTDGGGSLQGLGESRVDRRARDGLEALQLAGRGAVIPEG